MSRTLKLAALTLVLFAATSFASVPTRIAPAKPAQELTTLAGAHAGYLFRVSDGKGLLFTCVAPNADSDVMALSRCTIAPDHTFDDVIRTFLKEIQNLQDKKEAK